MNISASKILLGLSVAAYAYCTWDHLFSDKKTEAAANKPPALTAAMVNHIEVLSLGRDAFESVALDRTEDTAAANAIAAATGQALPGKSLGPLALQGIFMTPSGHAALINGVPVNEGEETEIQPGSKIFARKIGDTYAIVEAGGRTAVLKLADPSVAGTSPGAPAGAPASNNPAPSSPSSGSSPSPANHGGGSDPYAGHRTHH